MLLSAPIKCTLPLANFLRARPDMWEEVARYLKMIGVDIPIGKLSHMGEKEETKKNLAPISLNKVGDYCEGEDGNTTLPVLYQGVKTFAILDSGARVGHCNQRDMGVMGKTDAKENKNETAASRWAHRKANWFARRGSGI